MKKQKSKKLKTLTEWDWTTLVAAWRYYEYRMTIASSMFPADIVSRFFTGEYEVEECNKIAHQFCYTDHGRDGEKDWTGTRGDGLFDSDKEAWCKFYAFCKAWSDGFAKLHISNGKTERDCEAFYCEFTKHWHPKDEYINHPLQNIYIPNNLIKSKTLMPNYNEREAAND